MTKTAGDARRLRLLASVGFVLSAGFGARASAQQLPDGWSINTIAATGYSSNPFLQGDRTPSAYVELATTPRYLLVTELGQSAVEGRFRLNKYLQNLGTSSAYGITARHSRRLNEQLTVNGELDFDRSIVGERRDILDVSPLVPDTSPIPGGGLEVDPDASEEGLRQRRTVYRASGGVSNRLSERGTIWIGGEVQRVAFPASGTLTSYWSQAVSGSYTRVLSPVSRLGGALSAQRYAYDDNGGNFSIITPQLVYQRRLGALWTLDAAVGALVVRGRLPQGSTNSVDVSANLAACRRGNRSTLCVQAVREATASGLGGARKTSRAQLTYSYRLSDRDTIEVASSAASSEADGDNAKSTSSSLAYFREIRPRLSAGANIAFRTTSNSIVDSARDVQAGVSIGYRFGSRR